MDLHRSPWKGPQMRPKAVVKRIEVVSQDRAVPCSWGTVGAFKARQEEMRLILCLIALFLVKTAYCAGYEASTDPFTANFTLFQSTASVGTSSTLIISTRAARGGILMCNECASDIRIGNSAVTSAIGLLLAAGRCVTLDLPRYFRGALWGASTSGSCKVSAIEALP